MKTFIRNAALLALLAFPSIADAASRFWVGGTGTWDASTTTNWSATSGGAGGQSVPGSGDDVTFDGNSGAGTVTVNNASLSIKSLTTSAFTGTLDFSSNNNNITLQTFLDAATGVHTINMGNGTWTVTATNFTVWNITASANLTLNPNGSTLLFQSTPAGALTASFASKTYNNVSINLSGTNQVIIFGTATIGNLTLTSLKNLIITAANTVTLTNGLSYTGSSANPLLIQTSLPNNSFSAGTISSANNVTLTWAAINGITMSGGGAFSATNSFDLGRNSNTTITPPSSGGGGHIIGG